MYDLESALATDAVRPRERAEIALHPRRCGPCEDCREALADYAVVRNIEPSSDDFAAADRAYWRHSFTVAPTSAELRRHVRKFGPERVEETARAFGVTISVSTSRVTTTRRTKTQLARGLARAEAILADINRLPPTQTVRRIDEALSWLDGRRTLPTHITSKFVTALMRAGMTPTAIADKLAVSEKTVARALAETGRQ
jgi:hypothetical protein